MPLAATTGGWEAEGGQGVHAIHTARDAHDADGQAADPGGTSQEGIGQTSEPMVACMEDSEGTTEHAEWSHALAPSRQQRGETDRQMEEVVRADHPSSAVRLGLLMTKQSPP